MTRRLPRRLLRAAAPVALTAAALVALTACGDATPEQTQEHSTVAGLNTSVGDVRILDAEISVNLDGTSGQLLMALVNEGSGSDELTGVTSPRATFTLPAVADVSATPAPASPAADTSTTGVLLEDGAGVFLDKPPSSITVSGVTGGPLHVGDLLPLTMTFAAAGSITVSVPVAEDTIPTPYGLETATPAASQAGAEAEGSSSGPAAP